MSTSIAPYAAVTGPTCLIEGDPHVRSFTGSVTGSLPFPCLYLAATVFFSSSTENFGVDILTSSGLETDKGQYYIDYAQAHIYHRKDATRITIQVHETNPAKVAAAVQSNGSTQAWTQTVEADSIALATGSKVDVEGEAGHLVIGHHPSLEQLSDVEFHIEIKFFPRTESNPTHRGIEIKVNGETADNLHLISFPRTICSSLDDMVGSKNKPKGFTKSTMLLKAALDQDQDQTEAVCQDIFSTYRTCGDLQETALKQCLQYLKPRKAKCLERKGSADQAIKTFNLCMEYECSGGTTDDAFKELCG